MSGYLLDTHVLLWLATNDDRLTDRVRELVLNEDNALWLSVATVWEMAIKKSLGKLSLSESLERFLEGQRTALGFQFLSIQTRDAVLIEALPMHHRDPFDRLLVAQAIARQLTLVSRDQNLAAYEVPTAWG